MSKRIYLLSLLGTFMFLTLGTFAQTGLGLAIGTIDHPTPWSCSDAYYHGANGTATCFSTNISCPGTDPSNPIRLTFGFIQGGDANPSTKGVIVLFTGSGGTDITEAEDRNTDYTDTYLQAGYMVIEVQWGDGTPAYAWEGTSQGGGDSTYGIRYAACRPATFLNYVYYKYYVPMQTYHAHAGMCAQGFSGGSSAVGYALAWYGGGSDTSRVYLDNVELISGPTFSDIKKGCDPDESKQNIDVCGPSNSPPSWCHLGSGGSDWLIPPGYLEVASSIDIWSGMLPPPNPPTCTHNSSGDSVWLNMSIVNGTSNATFSYPNTKVADWICRTAIPGMNNSSSQGFLFDEQMETPPNSSTNKLAVYAVDNCGGDEGVNGSQAVVPAFPGCDPLHGGDCGFNAVRADMVANCAHPHN